MRGDGIQIFKAAEECKIISGLPAKLCGDKRRDWSERTAPITQTRRDRRYKLHFQLLGVKWRAHIQAAGFSRQAEHIEVEIVRRQSRREQDRGVRRRKTRREVPARQHIAYAEHRTCFGARRRILACRFTNFKERSGIKSSCQAAETRSGKKEIHELVSLTPRIFAQIRARAGGELFK